MSNINKGVEMNNDVLFQELICEKAATIMSNFSKYICIFSLVVTPILFKQNVALAGGGFTASCKNFLSIIQRGNPIPARLSASCRTTKGQFKSTYVDLNLHITNNNGNLAWQRNGGFTGSIRTCDVTFSKVTILTCEAARKDGSFVKTSITLDDQIANYDGNLTVLNGF